MRQTDWRDCPSEANIERIRGAFDVEPEVDRILTRKMRARSLAPYAHLTIDQVVAGLQGLLSARIGAGFTIENARWLAGGAAKLQMAFDLRWRGLNGTDEFRVDPMVVRMGPAESTIETSRQREFELLRAVQGHLAAPEPYFVDGDGEWMPYPALVYAFAEGVTKPPSSGSGQVSGIGMAFSPQWRSKLAPQVTRDLAALHRIDVDQKSFAALQVPRPGSNAGILKQIDWWSRVWEEDRQESEPLIEIAGQWLRRNAPATDRVSIVHGDFRSGNFLFSPETGEITAWLDWELGVVGDRHQDLAWITAYEFGNVDEDGRTFLACGLMPVEALLTDYQDKSGLTVDRDRLRYFKLFNLWYTTIICLATCHRSAKGGKSHQDAVVAWLSGLGYLQLEQVRQTLCEVAR
ncbi:phosphotransferase family protein [Sphingomonas sp. ID0503]|uniref:phosphotransferase family protein n=1 Tax=Sphingomonas sp. ID0503 TaxID=3399691 RepID=UPI003AFA9011